jgi:tripartite-type tricarboxylate transporter receptor subunit TctC
VHPWVNRLDRGIDEHLDLTTNYIYHQQGTLWFDALVEPVAMLSRRRFGMLAVGTALCSPASVSAQTYPDRPIRMMIGFPPGGTADTIGRIIAPALSERLRSARHYREPWRRSRHSGVEAVARAQPDGYTIVFASAERWSSSPHMQSNLRYDPFRDLSPICRVVGTPMVLVVGKHVQASTAKELQQFAKAHPGRMTFGSTAAAARFILRASCSRCGPVSTSCTCPIVEERRP